MRGRGLTLRGLCREAGLDPSFFSKVLAGKRNPPSDEAALRRIALALEIDAVELIVSAGRLPSEWRALWDDPKLFGEVHARATGIPVPADSSRIVKKDGAPAQKAAPPRPAFPRQPQAGRLPEELL
ncbi:MAG TPA: hypothetical protein DEB40_13925 [Elusimicrobia bacterium]|nr:hypothetical protein [Elusimicrobiota bacterium]HBT62832.1 hypothetical protein [Elusimicrobiota bacterium]